MAHSQKNARANSSRPVAPDAVRVWRGFRLPALMPPDFLTALGTVFIPVTAQLQRLYGLTAYLPTVLPTSKPQHVPDEIALVFYESQQAYTDTSKIVAGRAYSALHKTVFAFPASQSGFPVQLGSALNFDQPYFLFKDSVDWQGGYSQVFAGARPAAVTPAHFAAKLLKFLQSLQKSRPAGLDGAVCCVSAEWVLYWEHWTSEAASEKGHISELPKYATRVLLQPSVSQPVETSLTAHYPGIGAVESKSFNIIFPRLEQEKA
jgi:hypothetical protein